VPRGWASAVFVCALATWILYRGYECRIETIGRRRDRQWAHCLVPSGSLLAATGQQPQISSSPLSGVELAWRRHRMTAADDSYTDVSRNDSGLPLKSLSIAESQGNSVTEGIEQIVLSVAVLVTDAKALDLIQQVIS
jgi:hypothetical protein